MNPLQDIVKRSSVSYCLDCGKCSAICPITRFHSAGHTGPRLLVEKALGGNTGAVFDDPLFWNCLTCRCCSDLCPSEVHFIEFVRDARALAREENRSGPCTHGEVIQTWARIMTDPDLRQNRRDWLSDDLKTSERADTVLFVGCLPHYDRLFKNLAFEGIAIARAAVRILNALGIVPRVLADERCCGHDQLWQGDLATFNALAELNCELLTASGARRVVTACPECARTLALDYPHLVGDHGLQVVHLTQLIAEETAGGDSIFRPAGRPQVVTYQDPCRLGRHLGIYEPPRRLIEEMGYRLVEMQPNRKTAGCCGTSCWTACGSDNREIQIDRLRRADDTGSRLLVTACAKCQIHFRCAMQHPGPSGNHDFDFDIRDITTLIAERLK